MARPKSQIKHFSAYRKVVHRTCMSFIGKPEGSNQQMSLHNLSL